MPQSISTIRQRGQLTIPNRVREKYKWVSPGSPVTIDTSDPGKIVIEPYSESKRVDWEKLWRDIKRIRSYKGEAGGNLSAFIAKDRENRR